MPNLHFGFVLRSAWVACLGALLVTTTVLSAADPATAPTVEFNIPADNAENSLKRLSAQSGVEVLFPTSTVAGIRTNEVRGRMTARAALDAMLQGTGLVTVPGKNTTSLTVRRATDTAAQKNVQSRPASNRAATESSMGVSGGSEVAGSRTGSIEGRVLNQLTGAYLANVRVVVDGTSQEAVTDDNGGYRLSNVAAGEVRVRALYVGLETRMETIRIEPGQTTAFNFELSRMGATDRDGALVRMDKVTIVEDREMSAQTIALNEQRAAPNIKNVVAFDEYPNPGDPNIAEFLKFIPGVAISYSGYAGNDASVRGIPGSDTPITIDGASLAASSLGPGRNANLFSVPMNNISRIEVTKVPTPDMAASGLGGTINLISKSGFERKRPLFTYNVFSSFRSDDLFTFDKRVGPTSKLTTRHVLPSFELNYTRPINDAIAVSLSASQNLNYIESHSTSPGWDLVRLVQTSSAWAISPQLVQVRSGRVGFDWKMGNENVFTASIQYRKREAASAGSSFNTNIGAGATGGPTFVQGAATGVGTLTQSVGTWLELHNTVVHSTMRFSHKGSIWKADANAAYSVSKHDRPSTDKGYFSSVTGTITNLVVNAEGIDGSGKDKESVIPAVYRVVDRAGVPVNPYDGNNYSITAAAANAPTSKEEKREGRFDLGRPFELALPFSLKTGVSVLQREVTAGDHTRNYAFRTGQSVDVRKAGNYGLVDEAYSAAVPAYISGDKIQWISARKAFDLFKTNPEYFILNAASANTTQVNGSKRFEETIAGTYLRGDFKFFDNRLWLVTGVRYEGTANEGWGPLDDISAQYVKDASGNVVRNAAGQTTLISTDALVRSQLRYKERGSHAKGDYGNIFPSFNGTYTILDGLLARVGFAQTIGRPNLGLIIPGVTISEPTASVPTITVVDAGLQPWSANNYDLSLESYLIKGGFGSVGVFRKDISKFFISTATEATPELLESYGIPVTDTYLNSIVTSRGNGGDASITGMEFSYKQSLTFLPHWARGLQVFVNLTKLSLGGPSQADFTGFNPKTLSWGASFVRSRFAIRFTSSEQGETRRAPVAASASIPAGTYLWQGAKVRYTLGFEYALSRNVGFHVSLNNFNDGGVTDRQMRYGEGTPDYAKFQRFQEWGTNAVVGIKGEF